MTSETSVHFIYNPLWLLLFIPGAALALFLYFRVKKKHRRNRNRVTSLVIHMFIALLASVVMAGIRVDTTTYTESVDVMIVIDLSYSTLSSEAAINEFVAQVIEDSNNQHQIGIVTFARDAILAVPLGTPHHTIITELTNAPRPDSNATNIADALILAHSQFNDPTDGRILLVSDGVETNGQAYPIVANIAQTGTRVDAVLVQVPPTADGEVRIVSVVPHTPNNSPNVGLNQEVFFLVDVQSQSAAPNAMLRVEHLETGVQLYNSHVSLDPGFSRLFSFSFRPQGTGLQPLRFILTNGGDVEERNNVFYTFVYVAADFSVLIVEGAPNEARFLAPILRETHNVSIVGVADVPVAMADLLRYDQIILMNVAPDELPDGFEDNLYTYVTSHGGGLLTTGGENAYREQDFTGRNRPLERLMPVTASNDGVSMGLAIVIDSTTSMVRSGENPGVFAGAPDGFAPWQGTSHPHQISDPANPGTMIPNPNFGIYAGGTFTRLPDAAPTRLDLAIRGAYYAARALRPNDFMSLMHFHGPPEAAVHPMMPMTSIMLREDIIHGIHQPIVVNSGANLMPAITAARGQLMALHENVEIRHMLIVTDGLDGLGAIDTGALSQMVGAQGITFSFITIDAAPVPVDADGNQIPPSVVAPWIAATGGTFTHIDDVTRELLPQLMYTEVRIRSLQHEVIVPAFAPEINRMSPVTLGLGDRRLSLIPQITGYNGTRAQPGAFIALHRPFVDVSLDPDVYLDAADGGSAPIYAYWQRGNGNVGSFTSDLNGTFSAAIFANNHPIGRLMIYQIVRQLMPEYPIMQRAVAIDIYSYNMGANFVINTAPENIQDGQVLRAYKIRMGLNEISQEWQEVSRTFIGQSSTNILSGNIQKNNPGFYLIEARVVDTIPGSIPSHINIATLPFSYSYEHAMFWNPQVALSFLQSISDTGNGVLLAVTSTDLFNPELLSQTESFDTRLIFLIIIIALFLLDIIARKFKFKWPHEIIRAIKAKGAEKQPAH